MAGVDAGTIYSEVRVTLDKLNGDLRNVEVQFNKFGTTNTAAAKNTEKSWKSSFGNINIAGVAAFVAIGAAVKTAITTFAGFEQSMANVQSVARATPEVFRMLEEAALKAGETTRFSAKQAADAMYYLGAAGWNATQIMDGLNGVLQLAGATQSDLEFTSEMVTATISQFNLKASEAGRVANVMAAGCAVSQAEIDKLATSMSYVGPVASSMNMTLEDTVGVLSILYNNGLEASTAGTALRSVLADLSNTASPAVKKLADFGVTFDKVNPATNSFAQIIENLNPIMNDGGKIMQVFGDRAGPAMIKLLQAGREEIEKYTKSVTGTQYAAEAYATQNDTLQGSLDMFTNAVQNASIKTVKEFTPALRGIIDTAADVIKFIGNLPRPVKLFIGIAAGGIPVIVGLATAFKILAGALAGSAGIISLIVVGAAALVAALSALPHLFDPLTRAKDAEENLKKATDELVESSKDLDEINKKIAATTDDLTAAEKNLLEARREQKEALNAANVFKMVEALKTERKATVELEAQQKKQIALQQEIQKQMDGTRGAIYSTEKAWTDVYGIRGSGTTGGKNVIAVMEQLVNEMNNVDNQIKNNNSSYTESIKRLAELALADGKMLDLIRKQNPELAQQVMIEMSRIRQAELRGKKEKENADRKAKEDEKANENNRKAGEDLAFINQTLDSQKTTIDKLRETLTRLESIRGLTGQNEIGRQKAIKNLKEQIKKAEDEAAKQDEKKQTLAEEYGDKLEEINKTELELIEIQRRRKLEEAGANEEAIKNINAYYDELKRIAEDKQLADSFKETFDTITGFATQAFGSISSLIGAIADQRIAELDEQLQKELEAAGIAEESNIERLQRELEEARAAGDEELAIEKEKELAREKLTLEYERKKAKIMYEASLAQWALTLAQATADAAAGVIKAIPNIPLMIAAGVQGALGIAAIVAAKPVKPKFNAGGIVMGPAGRDQVEARLTAGEMVLTAAQQAELWRMLQGAAGTRSAGQRVSITLPVYLDGRKVAENSAEYYNGNVVVLQ